MPTASPSKAAAPHPGDPPAAQHPDAGLAVTALYTAAVWAWARFPGAALLASRESRLVFRLTNAALFLARLIRWGLPSLKHSLAHRHAMIDHLVRRSGIRQLLEIAAGLSPRALALTADPAWTCTELDLEGMVTYKRQLLGRTPEGRDALARPNLALVPGDARTHDLGDLVRAGEPLVIVTEGLLMYLKEPEQRALWKRLAAVLSHTGAGGELIFDLVPAREQPKPGLIGRALAWLMARFTGGRTFEVDARTREDLVAALHEAGFAAVELYEPKPVAEAWQLPYPRKRTQTLIFRCGVPGPAPLDPRAALR